MENQFTKNEFIIKLIFSSIKAFETHILFDKISNKRLNNIILRLLNNIEDIFKSYKSQKKISYAHKACIETLALLPNNTLISASRDAINIWDINTWDRIRTLKPPQDFVSAAVLPQGIIVSTSSEGLVKTWDTNNNFEEDTIMTGKYAAFRVLTLLTNSYLAFSAYYEDTFCIIILDHYNRFECIKIIKAHTKQINSLVNLTGNKFATGSGDGTIKIWDADDGYNCLNTLYNDNWVLNLRFINEKGLLLAGTFNEMIKVWDVNGYECIKTIDAHNGGVCSFLLLPRGYFATGSLNSEIKFWKLDSFEFVCCLDGDGGGQKVCLFLLNNDIIISSAHESIVIWKI
jgi:WD40 repeat protein